MPLFASMRTGRWCRAACRCRRRGRSGSRCCRRRSRAARRRPSTGSCRWRSRRRWCSRRRPRPVASGVARRRPPPKSFGLEDDYDVAAVMSATQIVPGNGPPSPWAVTSSGLAARRCVNRALFGVDVVPRGVELDAVDRCCRSRRRAGRPSSRRRSWRPCTRRGRWSRPGSGRARRLGAGRLEVALDRVGRRDRRLRVGGVERVGLCCRASGSGGRRSSPAR